MPANAHPYTLELVDTHAGGDVSRILVGGVKRLPGETLVAQLEYLRREADGLRLLLLYEPYGDPFMSVNLVQPAVSPKACAGFITMESMGYPYFSGSNTLCTAATLMERLGVRDAISLETPDGLVQVQGRQLPDHSWEMTCEGSPAYVVQEGMSVEVNGYGEVTFDLVFSGALYAVVSAPRYGLVLERTHEPELIAFAHALVTAARPSCEHHHPLLGTVAPLPFVHFEGDVERGGQDTLKSRTATFVYPNVICRSPTGTGTAARLALMHARGERSLGQALATTSPRGNGFLGRIVGETVVGPYQAIRCTTTGRVFTLARTQVQINPEDPHLPKAEFLQVLDSQASFA